MPNGEYGGPLKVREIPPGVTGDDLRGKLARVPASARTTAAMRNSSSRGLEKQRMRALERADQKAQTRAALNKHNRRLKEESR